MSEQNQGLRLFRSLAMATLLTAAALAAVVASSSLRKTEPSSKLIVPAQTSSKYPIVLPSAAAKASIQAAPAQVPTTNVRMFLRES